MELRHLRTFLTVAETLNISEAARRLRFTQPALSRQIRELEHDVGHTLFVRHHGGLKLTAAGATLQEHGSTAIASIDDAVRKTRGRGAEAAAVLRLGYIGSMGMWAMIIAPALKGLRREFPHVTPAFSEASSAELAAELRTGRLDVGILGPGDAGRTPGIVSTLVGAMPAVVMLPADHRLAKKREIALSELRNEEIISLPQHLVPGRDRTLIACCRAAGFKPRITAIATGPEELMNAVSSRGAIAFVTPFGQRGPHPGVTFSRLKPPPVMLEAYVAHTPKCSPAGRRLTELLVAEMRRAAASVK